VPPAVSPRWPLAAGADSRPALGLGERQVTYGELAARAAAAAGWLAARGVRAGDRVLLPARKDLAFVALHLGALRLSALSVPFDPAAGAAAVDHLRADSDARLLADPGEPPAGPPAPAAPVAAGQPALLLYTSGTTGRPKGVVHTHGSLLANLAALHAAWDWRPDDVLVHALPLFHAHGLFVALHGTLYAGASCALLERFEAVPALDELRRRRATLFMGVPTMYHRLAALPEGAVAGLRGVRLWVSGSAPLRASDRLAFRARFGADILERYGMTETLMIASQPLAGPRAAGDVGRALPGVELRVVDKATREPLPAGEVGEVQARGPSLCTGYWRAPEASAEILDPDGWLSTGDLGCLAADGTLTLVGRRKELVISGGFNVYPLEVESTLAGHPDVAECAVFGVPDDDLGEAVAAAIVPAPGRRPDMEALREHGRACLAPYKVPRHWLLVPELPRTALGKVNRAALAARCAGEAARG